ncbi:CAP domain-containing protein [Cellulomonas sp. P24]|uniref:CAP domain-containing protein n=1 Tax=Cellulomonas sp. P24 TaxID=2885206 RepID=UPI00216AECFF|nr:CAP domain-containing protein [Cellulomonas sp. P24]MCR6491499.1 CAP domain-containing protein [Cellulomonas sp. P24]
MSSEESGRAQRVVASCVGAWHLRRRRVHARPVRVRPSRSRPARSWAARVALVLLVMGVGVGAVPLGVGASPAAAADDAAAILVQVNQARAAVGAPPLRLSSAMSAVATRWSTHLADSGTCPGGLAHNPSFSQQIPRGWSAAGENVACNTSADALGLEAQWMSSAPHRANILNPAYTDIGIGIVVRGRTAWGTQNFGTYSSAPAPEPALLPAPAPPAPTPTPHPHPVPVTVSEPDACPHPDLGSGRRPGLRSGCRGDRCVVSSSPVDGRGSGRRRAPRCRGFADARCPGSRRAPAKAHLTQFGNDPVTECSDC